MENCAHYWIIIGIMLFSGFLGGFGNYLMLKKQESENPHQGNLLIRSIVLGLIASFCVPLFLKTISSNLLDKPVSTNQGGILFNSNYFVLAGFCLLASVLSKQFLESLYEKVIKAQEDAKKAVHKAEAANEKAEDVVASLTEKDIQESSSTNKNDFENAAPNLIVSLEDQIITSIRDSKYIWRSISGIAKNLNKQKSEIQPIIDKLMDEGRLESKLNSQNQTRYKVKF